jgi:uncharacterized membrane protein
MLTLDDSATGKHIKANLKWLRMRDAATARLIASTVAGGILSFTVFSFSMVMIVLNQTAGKMSNRILDLIIRNRFQQFVLGCYTGTVLYSLFLITAIRDIDSGIYVPALSTYLLIIFSILDIFLFIYFLHFVTQNAKYQTIINRIHTKTLEQLKQGAFKENIAVPSFKNSVLLLSPESGYLQGFDASGVKASEPNIVIKIELLHPVGSYSLQGINILKIYCNKPISAAVQQSIVQQIEFDKTMPDHHYLSGFSHLTEVAIKALSPGINDPATAILSLHSLTDLFAWLLQNKLQTIHTACNNKVIITHCHPTVESMINTYLRPIWDYGKDDRSIQAAMKDMLSQLLQINTEAYPTLGQFLQEVEIKTMAGR